MSNARLGEGGGGGGGGGGGEDKFCILLTQSGYKKKH